MEETNPIENIQPIVIQTIPDEIRKKLREPMPKEAVKPHPTKTFLSTIKAIYVVERLNDVFGVGRWNLITEIAKETDGYILMQGELKLLDYDASIPKQYGGHTTTGKNTELADGYKSAITDCLSKCASYLEIGIDVFKGKVNTKGESSAGKPTDSDLVCSVCGTKGKISYKKNKDGVPYCPKLCWEKDKVNYKMIPEFEFNKKPTQLDIDIDNMPVK